MNYIRRVAVFVLKDKEGKVILQHRDKYAPILPNYWGFFGGSMENGEMPEETVRREAREELEIELPDLKFFKRYEFQEKEGLKEKFLFIAPLIISVEKLKEQQKEGNDLGLFSLEDLRDLKISDSDKFILKDLFNV